MKGPEEFKESHSVISKMIITYKKRKLGIEYLQNTFTSVQKDFLNDPRNINFELDALKIYNSLKLSKEDGLPTLDIARGHPEVKKVIKERIDLLIDVSKIFVKVILDSLNKLPYGLRLICKQIKDASLERFPKTKERTLWKVVGHTIYFRFLNPAVVTPSEVLTIGEINMQQTTNLVAISKVLQALFDLREFDQDSPLFFANDYLHATFPQIEEYFKALINVPPPEQFLQVDEYMELTIKNPPFIIISVRRNSSYSSTIR